MATFQGIFAPSSGVINVASFTGTLSAGANATVILAPRAIFAVTVTADSNIAFGNVAHTPAADANSWPIWAKSVQEWETGEEFDRINLFSTAGGVYYVRVLSRN